jgi:hypothetical protein
MDNLVSERIHLKAGRAGMRRIHGKDKQGTRVMVIASSAMMTTASIYSR